MKRLTILAALLLAGCSPTTGGSVKSDNDEKPLDPWLYQDRATGCEYLAPRHDSALIPRVAADSKTHMGCKAVQP